MADDHQYVHKEETLRLAALVENPLMPVVRNHRFEDCWLLGPAVLLIAGSQIDGIGWGGTVDEVWSVLQSSGLPAGAIHMDDCEFVRCQFVGVGFVGTADQIAQAQEHTAD